MTERKADRFADMQKIKERGERVREVGETNNQKKTGTDAIKEAKRSL